jgi:hypothetical protein
MGKKTAKAVVFVTLDSNGILEPVEPVRATPGSAVVFVLGNESKQTYKVEIKDFVVKETKLPPSPISTAAAGKKTLSPGEVDVIKAILHPAAAFGAGKQCPYTTYKYTVEVTDGAGAVTVYDPDIDVPPA